MRVLMAEAFATLVVMAIVPLLITASENRSDLLKKISVCSSRLPETLNILCASRNSVRDNFTNKRNENSFWHMFKRPQIIKRKEHKDILMENNDNDNEHQMNNLGMYFKSKKRSIKIVEECCYSKCSYRQLSSYCPRALSSEDFYQNLQDLLTQFAITDTPIQSTATTPAYGTIFTDTPSNYNIFSLE
ncbi:hypothetical protein CHUAL_005513 [Chamberlinius hualienensis]